ncbi:uncharacterized protein LOC106653034 isoform X2 [Trichogramma pretiosum]|uniref:uncharacterized protein LOC106653034 isoform X2 n=1 Tax=Trichogramma pretiosum TaxID=7493 RepID=UPI000C7189D4|nr:uncharacterized protein LOC106653034 isoform X2 [Trichogramma pretiosum]
MPSILRQGMAIAVNNSNNASWTTITSSVSTNGATTTSTTPTTATTYELPPPTLSEREQLKIEFYKTYDVMTGIRIAATLGGFFTIMVLLVIYKSRCKANRQLDDPRLTAAAEAAVAEAEAEERALAAALEAIARLPPKPPGRGPRRSLCVEPFVESHLPLTAPRFSSVGGGYDSLLSATRRFPKGSNRSIWAHRRTSSITCSSTASSYLERRGSAMVMPCLPPPPSYPRHAVAYDETYDYYHPIDIQVIQPTPELSPCGSEAGLYGSVAVPASYNRQQQQQPQYRFPSAGHRVARSGRAPLASMGSVDPPEPDSRSLGSDSVFLEEARGRDEEPPDTEDEVSAFSTDSSDETATGHNNSSASNANLPKRFLKVPPKKKRAPERWDVCVGCVPRRRTGSSASAPPPMTPKQHQQNITCMTISASIDDYAPIRPVLSSSSSQNSAAASGLLSPPRSAPAPIELRHRPGLIPERSVVTTRSSSTPGLLWSQETLF